MFFTVGCHDCGAIVQKSFMKLVRRSVGDCYGTRRYRDWYCQWCAPGYDRVKTYNCDTTYWRDSVVCNEAGELLKGGAA